MSHNPDAVITCPNCGYHAQYNYCAQCGQATHLHKDTFWGLIIHFVEHYFHYDSKFWKTLKALWLKPGALTIAYIDKQRQRFIPPISLYIFLSALFFIALHFSPVEVPPDTLAEQRSSALESTKVVKSTNDMMLSLGILDSASYKKSEEKRLTRLQQRLTSTAIEPKDNDGILSIFSKIFFFLIPFTALILQVLFARRSTMSFVDHAVFSLHCHAFLFTIMLLTVVDFTDSNYISIGLFCITAVYFVLALRKVYSISVVRAICYTLITALVYVMLACIIFFTLFQLSKHFLH